MDEDCDGLADDEDTQETTLNGTPAAIFNQADTSFHFYIDSDADGLETVKEVVKQCNAPIGYVSDNTDCDDNDPNLNPTGFGT